MDNNICRFWNEEDIEICKVSLRSCVCGAHKDYCSHLSHRYKALLELNICPHCEGELIFDPDNTGEFEYARCDCGEEYTKKIIL